MGEESGGEVGVVEARDGGEFNDIGADDAAAGGDAVEEGHGLVPEEAAGDGCAGGGHERGVEGVDIEGDVDFLREGLGQGSGGDPT